MPYLISPDASQEPQDYKIVSEHPVKKPPKGADLFVNCKPEFEVRTKVSCRFYIGSEARVG